MLPTDVVGGTFKVSFNVVIQDHSQGQAERGSEHPDVAVGVPPC